MSKRVLFACKNMNIGGVEKSLLSLLNTLSPSEYDVDLLLLEDYGGFMEQIPSWVNVRFLNGYAAIRDEVNLPPAKVILHHLKKIHICRAFSLGIGYVLSKITGNTSHYFRAVFRKIPMLEDNYDVAISYTSIISYLTWYIVHHVKATYKVGWVHFDVSKLNYDSQFLELLHAPLDRIYIVSPQAYSSFVTAFPALKHKCEIKYNVIDAQMILELAKEPADYINSAGYSTIVTLGRLSPEKGQDIIPEIALRLKEHGVRFRWYLIGDGNLRGKLERDIQANHLEDEIILLGTKINPYPYLKQADLYVQTSIHEGFCITLAEAKAFDLPIVSTDCAGAHEQLDGRENCCVVERDVDALYQAISHTLTLL